MAVVGAAAVVAAAERLQLVAGRCSRAVAARRVGLAQPVRMALTSRQQTPWIAL